MNILKFLLVAAATTWLTFVGGKGVHAQAPAKIYAQQLVDETLAKHPELNALTFHVTPPNSGDNIIIASNIAPYGKKADEDDLAVMAGKIVQEPNKAGDRYGVALPLVSASGRAIGALNVGFVYKKGDDTTGFLKKAEAIRDELAVKIGSEAKLMVPMP